MPNTKKTKRKPTKLKLNLTGTHPASTKEEKKKAKEIKAKYPFTKEAAKKLKRVAPTVVFITPTGREVLTYSNSKFNPAIIQWGYDYILDCYESFEKAEVHLKPIINHQHEMVETKDGTFDEETGEEKVVTERRTVSTFEVERERLVPKDRYVHPVWTPTMSGLVMWYLRKHRFAITRESLEQYRKSSAEFAQMVTLLLAAQDELIQQHSNNGMGNSTIQKLILMNNHGYQDIKQIQKDSTVNVNVKGLFDEMYAISHMVKTPEREQLLIEGKEQDINHIPNE